MNEQTRMKIAKKNKCDPNDVNCEFCFYLDSQMPFCNYHKCSLLNFSESCYKFKHIVKSNRAIKK